ncbi:MAG: NigD-like N-terminal domain-containing protein [Bacteroides sp.]|nr:NigD-like N-terminal domain-containing protein [Bacteroides sp.]
MKKERFFSAALVLLLLVVPGLQSCLDDWDNKYKESLFAIGTLHIVEDNEYYFELDEGSTLYPGDTTALHNYVLNEGQRAFVYFTKLDEDRTGYDYNAAIQHIENILTKDAYVMPAEKEDSIGDDRITLVDMWLTDEHLNLQYQLYHGGNSNKKHMLNLVVNQASTGEGEKEDYLTVEFRQNAFDDTESLLGTGIVSFRLDPIVPLMENLKGLNIRYRSLYGGIKYSTIDFADKQ